MPKVKVNKSLSRRFKITKKGKVIFRGSCVRHLMSHKSKSRKRRQKQTKFLSGRMAIKIKKAMAKK